MTGTKTALMATRTDVPPAPQEPVHQQAGHMLIMKMEWGAWSDWMTIGVPERLGTPMKAT